MPLTRAEILAANDLTIQKVSATGWGEVCVKVMDGVAREKFDTALSKGLDANGRIGNVQKMRVLLVILTVCDEAGVCLFADADADALAKKSSVAMDAIYKASAKLNALGAADIEEARADFLPGPAS